MVTRFRDLPSVDAVLGYTDVAELSQKYGRELTVYAVRLVISRVREDLGRDPRTSLSRQTIVDGIRELVTAISGSSLTPVINATGVILHTNLGRAPLGKVVVEEIKEVLTGYSNLEFNLKEGSRGNRLDHINELIKYLTGAAKALVVNNNAAGIVLTLNTLAGGREVIISRGELIEIGGSFRIPEIMAASGVQMIEVGTTNRTRLSDYEKAIGPRTALLFKAHKSNYYIKGYTEEAGMRELADLAHARDIPFVYDLGTGLLRKPEKLLFHDEPDIKTVLESGADLVLFSCDKLLGSTQAGIIAGRSDLVALLEKAPMMRAMRVGKVTLAALASACRCYLDEKRLFSDLPLFSMLDRTVEQLEKLSRDLVQRLQRLDVEIKIVESQGHSGGGSLPDINLKSLAVKLTNRGRNKASSSDFARQMYERLLKSERPIVSIVRQGELYLDMLTVFKEDIPYIATELIHATTEVTKN